MKILITGIAGMAGSHLAEYLLAQNNCEIHGILRRNPNHENISSFENDLHLHKCDLQDPHATTQLIKKIKPHHIYHLAAQTSVAASWISPHETLSNNITAQLNVFESIRQLNLLDTHILIPGSSEEYGMVYEEEIPVKESNPLRPLSPYAVSKIAQNNMAYQYHMSYGLKVIRTRTFNHTGPRRPDMFVTSNFAMQIAEIEFHKRKPVIQVGNLDAKRDFSDIRDVVQAYTLAIKHCEPGEVYNIGSGTSYSIKQVLELLMGMTNIIIQVKPDPSRMRPSDVPVMRCDNSKFIKKTGWHPQIPFEQTLYDLLEYWREKLREDSIFGKTGYAKMNIFG